MFSVSIFAFLLIMHSVVFSVVVFSTEAMVLRLDSPVNDSENFYRVEPAYRHQVYRNAYRGTRSAQFPQPSSRVVTTQHNNGYPNTHYPNNRDQTVVVNVPADQNYGYGGNTPTQRTTVVVMPEDNNRDYEGRYSQRSG